MDEEGVPVLDCPSDKLRYKIGTDGAQFMTPFMCDICIFHLLFQREVTNTVGDREHLIIIRRMNLDAMWAREPTTIKANLRSLSKLVTTCENVGIQIKLPKLGPVTFEDNAGYAVAFSMLLHSTQPGKHSRAYTQFATIRKQRSAFSNLHFASAEIWNAPVMLNAGSTSNGILSSCTTQSQWFMRWSQGCETRMGYILKQNKAISTIVLRALIKGFKHDIQHAVSGSNEQWHALMGLGYTVISFFASLRGSEGLKVDYNTLMKYWEKGTDNSISVSNTPPHVIIPIIGRFKGEHGERCHLLPLSNVTKSGIHIRNTLQLILTLRQRSGIHSSWLFCDKIGNKITFEVMNEIILEKLEFIKAEDHNNKLLMQETNVREEFSINRSFRRGSATAAQLAGVPVQIIELANRWKKVERSKGRKAQLSMVETYADIEMLIPRMAKYSAML